MERLGEKIEQCRRCELWQTRNHPIVGEGNPNGELFVIGEAPGREEDRIGRPFVGRSGLLLDKIFAACGFNREEHLFISNIVRCRPPDNRQPTMQEAAACIPWLYEQIEMVNPKIIVLLGATALRYMAGNRYRITADHGKWIINLDRIMMPIYHPAALLRNPNLKRDTWNDCQRLFHKYRELVDPSHSSPHIAL